MSKQEHKSAFTWLHCLHELKPLFHSQNTVNVESFPALQSNYISESKQLHFCISQTGVCV